MNVRVTPSTSIDCSPLDSAGARSQPADATVSLPPLPEPTPPEPAPPDPPSLEPPPSEPPAGPETSGSSTSPSPSVEAAPPGEPPHALHTRLNAPSVARIRRETKEAITLTLYVRSHRADLALTLAKSCASRNGLECSTNAHAAPTFAPFGAIALAPLDYAPGPCPSSSPVRVSSAGSSSGAMPGAPKGSRSPSRYSARRCSRRLCSARCCLR